MNKLKWYRQFRKKLKRCGPIGDDDFRTLNRGVCTCFVQLLRATASSNHFKIWKVIIYCHILIVITVTWFRLHLKQLHLASGCTWSSFNLLQDAPEVAARSCKLPQLKQLLHDAPDAAVTCFRMHLKWLHEAATCFRLHLKQLLLVSCCICNLLQVVPEARLLSNYYPKQFRGSCTKHVQTPRECSF